VEAAEGRLGNFGGGLFFSSSIASSCFFHRFVVVLAVIQYHRNMAARQEKRGRFVFPSLVV
jgi:hypothetical protein